MPSPLLPKLQPRIPPVSQSDAENANDQLQFSEEFRLKVKIGRVLTFWNKSSLLIPNVFRLAKLLEEDAESLLEHQDLSRKEVLVLSNGQKAKTRSVAESLEDSEEVANEGKRKSGREGLVAARARKKVKKSKGSILRAMIAP